MSDKKKRLSKDHSLASKSGLVAPVNPLDEKTAKTLFENQKILLGHLIELKRHVILIKREMRDEIEKEVVKNFDDKVHLINSALRETVIQKEILIDKKFMTREEVNKKYDELRKKKK